jgi:acetyl esterase/lipase
MAGDPTAGVTVHRDLRYATVGDQELALDLYVPDGGPAPLCVWLHGGGWARGARDVRAAERLLPVARSGVAIAAVQYRLSGQATFPAPLDDVRAAVRWLRREAGSYGLDAARVGVWGASAGGHLGALLALVPDDRDDELGDSTVQAAVCWFPPTDLLLRDTDVPEGPPPPFLTGPPASPSLEAQLLGAQSVRDVAEAARAASPVARVHPGAPPFLLMHGDRDGLIPSAHSHALHRELRAQGVDASLVLLAGANHEDPAFETAASLGAVSAFLRSTLLPATPPH